MESFRVNVQPSVLKWAREAVCLSEEAAAKKIGVSVERLRAWEEGTVRPTFRQLETMAAKYKRPVAVLYLQRPPRHFDALRDYRRTLESAGVALPYELATELERVRMQQDVLQEIYELDDLPLPQLDLLLKTDMIEEKASSDLRIWLGLSQVQQRQWARTAQLVPRLSELIEARGILVTQVQKVPVSVMRGCAISHRAFPAIVLNGADAKTAKVFTLIHEVVHILLQAGGDSEVVPVTRDVPTTDTKVEKFCNRVAAATLIPAQDLLAREPIIAKLESAQWDVGGLEIIAADYGVSPEALMLRLVELKLASWSDYWAIRPDFAVRHAAESASTDAPIYYPLKVRDLGKRYINDVVASYHRKDITTSDIANYLDIKINNLPKLLRLVSVNVS